MAIYQTRNCICAVQWDPEDKQSLENIKALVKDNPRLGWKAWHRSDNAPIRYVPLRGVSV